MFQALVSILARRLTLAITIGVVALNPVFSADATSDQEQLYPDPLPIQGTEDYLLIQRDTGTGVISSKGKILIAPVYNEVNYVGCNRFITRHHDQKTHDPVFVLRNETGKPLAKLDERAQGCEPFHEGILRIGYDEYLTYINLHGDTIAKPGIFSYGYDFSCGLASVHLLNSKNKNGAYINKHGKIVLGPYLDADGGCFQNGFAIVSHSDGNKAGVINRQGRVIIPRIYDSLFSSNGLQFFACKNGKSMLLSNSNRVLANFPDNCIAAKLPEDLSDTSLIPCQFSIQNSSEINSPKSLWGFCDIHGKILIPPRFDGCDWTGKDFFGVYMTDADGTLVPGLIDREGNWIHKPVFRKEDASANLLRRWKLGTPERQQIFSKLLNRYNFIGMTETELTNVLGQEGGTQGDFTYTLTPGAICGNMARILHFNFDNNRVNSWQISGLTMPPGELQVQVNFNAILKDPKVGLVQANLGPKHPGSLPGGAK